MYGCLPCPKCDSKYVAPYKRNETTRIECGDCGYKADAVRVNEDGVSDDEGDCWNARPSVVRPPKARRTKP